MTRRIAQSVTGLVRELTRLGAAVRLSYGQYRILLIVWLLGGWTVCCSLAVLTWLCGLGGSYFYADYYAQGFAGSMTLLSGQCLATAGVFVFVRAWQERTSNPESTVPWVTFGLGLLVLSADEVLMLHERATNKMKALNVPKLLGVVDQDLYVFMLYGIIAVVLMARLWPAILRSSRAVFPLVAAAVFMLGSQAIDVLPWDLLTRAQQGVLGQMEEILKTLGSWSLLLYGVLVAGAPTQRPVAGSEAPRQP